MTVEGIQVVHALPGRVRLKVARVKGNPEQARKMREKLAGVPGVKKVEANPDTGSLLILHDLVGPLAEEALGPLSEFFGEFFPEVEALALIGWITSLAETPLPEGNPGAGLVAGVKALNTEVGRLTGGLDLKLLVPFTLFFFGVRGLLAADKKVFPAWHDYLWFAFSTLVMLNRGLFEGDQKEDGPPGGEAGSGS